MQADFHQKHILRMLLAGATNQQMSCELGIDRDAVKQHMRAILARLRSANAFAPPSHPATGAALMM